MRGNLDTRFQQSHQLSPELPSGVLRLEEYREAEDEIQCSSQQRVCMYRGVDFSAVAVHGNDHGLEVLNLNFSRN